MAARYPEVLMDMGEHLAKQLEAKGLSQEQASDVAFELTEFMRSHWGGADIYIPKGTAMELSQRDLAIYADWRAKLDTFEMMRKYHVSVQRLGQIIRAVRLARRQKATELPLFESAG